MEHALIYVEYKFNGDRNSYKTAMREVIYNRRIHQENQLYKTQMTLV